jgi:hypothetical protein
VEDWREHKGIPVEFIGESLRNGKQNPRKTKMAESNAWSRNL